MKAKIRAILEKYGIDNYHWKPEITKELAVLFEEQCRDELLEFSRWFNDEPYTYISKDTIEKYLKQR